MEYNPLKLENQLCFPVYVASRLIIREYQPMLDELGITYPQYLVLMLLWEEDGLPVNDIAKKLILNTNTVTPLLKRIEKSGIISRTRCETDERKVLIHLSEKGHQMREAALKIPERLFCELSSGELNLEGLSDLRNKMNSIIDFLLKRKV